MDTGGLSPAGGGRPDCACDQKCGLDTMVSAIWHTASTLGLLINALHLRIAGQGSHELKRPRVAP